jgi:hypothetical protein
MPLQEELCLVDTTMIFPRSAIVRGKNRWVYYLLLPFMGQLLLVDDEEASPCRLGRSIQHELEAFRDRLCPSLCYSLLLTESMGFSAHMNATM